MYEYLCIMMDKYASKKQSRRRGDTVGFKKI